MNLLVPAGLALGLTLPVVVAFYLLKVRRHDEEISSTFLWEDVIRDLAAHEPLQRLRWNVLLVLQLIGLALLTLGLSRPFLQQVGRAPQQAILVLDDSASMQATDVSPTRFAQAVGQARSVLANLPDNSQATVMLAGAHSQILVNSTTNRGQADQALAGAQPSAESGNMREALLLARSLGADPAARDIYVFTDGAFSLPTDLPDDLGKVTVEQVGTDAGNVGITTISSRPDPQNSNAQQVFARVQNFSDTSAQVTLAASVDGSALDSRPLSLPANGSLDQVFEGLAANAHLARLQLTGTAGSFSLDKSAFVVLTQHQPTKVLLVSDGNEPLQRILTLLPGVDLYQVATRRYLSVGPDQYDVIVFDSYMPPVLPRGNLLLLNPTPRDPVQVTGTLVNPSVASWDSQNPLLQYVDVSSLSVRRAERVSLPAWAQPAILTTDNQPLLLAGQDGARHVVVLPFDLTQSNLPQSPAFPILMANALSYLAPPGVVQASAIQTGDVETLLPLPQVSQVRITDPNNQVTQATPSAGQIVYAATQSPGIYHVQQLVTNGSQTLPEDLFAANLSNPDESDLRPRLSGLDSSANGADVLTTLQKEFGFVALALVLPLLLVEWYWFHRRV